MAKGYVDVAAGMSLLRTSHALTLRHLRPHTPERNWTMGLVIALVLLALILGGVGLAVEALQWLLIIAVILFIVSAITGFMGRGRTRV
jgi:hypothetical protein